MAHARFAVRTLIVLVAAVSLVACGKPFAMGEVSSILVVTPDSVWAGIEEATRDALEPTTFTVRDERVFTVTQVSPDDEEFGRLQVMRQLILVGEPGDPWVQRALDEAEGPVPLPPAVVRAKDVWARNQGVTVILMPPDYEPEDVRPYLSDIGRERREDFERWARQRMFVSGADSARTDSLARVAGFRLVAPRVYRVREPEAGVYVFRNDNPDPSKLIRSLLITSRPSGEVPLSAEAARAWREELEARVESPPQVTEAEIASTRRLRIGNAEGIQVQGVWRSAPGEWPAAGPFLTRLVRCPEQGRTFLLDAWLYAPDQPKYEFMVQLETLLDSFRCVGA